MAEQNGSLGPISYLVVEFPGSKMTGEGLPILVDLVGQGVIRILDLVFVAKGEDGSLGIIALADLDHDGTIDLAVFEGASSGLVSQEDLADAAPVIAPGSSAAILIFENRWATSFVQALRRGGAELVAAGYIPQTISWPHSTRPKAERRPPCRFSEVSRAPRPSPERPPPCRTVSRAASRIAGPSKTTSSMHNNNQAHAAAPTPAAPRGTRSHNSKISPSSSRKGS